MYEDIERSPFCHIVIPAPDLDLSLEFYSNVFGWEVQKNIPGRKYWFFKSGNIGGALDGNRRPASGSVLLILRVNDINAMLEKIKQHGGIVTRNCEAIGEADAGYDAYFLDPNGNEIGLYSM